MQFQVLFSRRDPELLVIDGLLHVEDEPAQPVTLVGTRSESGLLSQIIPATLDEWAEQGAVVDLRDTGHSLELKNGDTRITLHPLDTLA